MHLLVIIYFVNLFLINTGYGGFITFLTVLVSAASYYFVSKMFQSKWGLYIKVPIAVGLIIGPFATGNAFSNPLFTLVAFIFNVAAFIICSYMLK
jgi:hypothetical protein